jgi:hypothetical protein
VVVTSSEAFEAIDSWSCILIIMGVPCTFVMFNRIVVEVRYFSGLCFCMRKMLYLPQKLFLSLYEKDVILTTEIVFVFI